jgi:hypothetical protein
VVPVEKFEPGKFRRRQRHRLCQAETIDDIKVIRIVRQRGLLEIGA